MTSWTRRSTNGSLDNLARKARRRGDAKEAALWYRAMNLRQHADERYNAAIAPLEVQLHAPEPAGHGRRTRTPAQVRRLHPQQVERAKAAEAAETTSS